jgi:phage baseplate assembly protein W
LREITVKTFALIQGDLSPAPGGYLLYSGPQKIHQDLTLALREGYGEDAIHPRWGSILKDMVGSPITDDVRQQVLNEVNRVLSNYITVQNARIVQDSTTGSSSALTTDDIVGSVVSVNAQQIYDSLVVTAVLQTLSRQQINVQQIIS